MRLRPLSEFKMPLPPLKVSTELIEALDPCHTLIHDQSQELPREIAGRKPQFKFYRT